MLCAVSVGCFTFIPYFIFDGVVFLNMLFTSTFSSLRVFSDSSLKNGRRMDECYSCEEFKMLMF